METNLSGAEHAETDVVLHDDDAVGHTDTEVGAVLPQGHVHHRAGNHLVHRPGGHRPRLAARSLTQAQLYQLPLNQQEVAIRT